MIEGRSSLKPAICLIALAALAFSAQAQQPGSASPAPPAAAAANAQPPTSVTETSAPPATQKTAAAVATTDAGPPASGNPAATPAAAAAAAPVDPNWWKDIDWHALARRDKMEFLRKVQIRANQVTQFTATFSKQERIRGKLRDEEIAFMKWRSDPFSVYLKYEKGDRGRQVLFVNGQRGGKALVKLGGLLGFMVVEIDPHGDQAMEDNLRPITMAGLPNILNASMPEFELALANGDLTVQYLGRLEIGGRKAYTIKRILPRKDIYPAKELVIFIDVETLVPIGADTYDWDGQLEARYRYSNVNLEPKLADRDFNRDNKEYGF